MLVVAVGVDPSLQQLVPAARVGVVVEAGIGVLFSRLELASGEAQLLVDRSLVLHRVAPNPIRLLVSSSEERAPSLRNRAQEAMRAVVTAFDRMVPMSGVALIGGFFPEIKGWLEAVFIGLLVLLAGAVGMFALFVIAQQFRNPGRREGSGR
jgi:hypothetical protein